MEFRVLGPVEVASGAQRVAPTSGRRRAILAVLLAAGGEVVSTDRLVDAAWPDGPPASALKTLRSHVSQLRQELRSLDAAPSDGGLLTEGGGYRIDLRAHELDANRFEAATTRARSVLPTAPEDAVALLDEALGWWRGAAFGEFADHDVVRTEALRLEQRRTMAAADRTDAQLALGRHAEVVGDLAAAGAASPLDERLHGQFMLALYRSGHQAEALATYERLRAQLRDELGVDPAVELRELHARMLRQDDDLTVTPSPTPPPGREPPAARLRRQLPARRVGELIGRDDDVAAVASLVTTHPMVTLTGPGGVGKTRLAEQVANVATSNFEDGTATCVLSAVRDANSVGPALLDALGLEDRGHRPPEQVLVDALGTRRLLLVVDNCEHLLATVSELVEQVLRRCTSVAVLATSREHLHLPGERVWQVAPLTVPRPGAGAAAVARSAAGQLFVARAEAADPGFALSEANAGAIAELCRRLDGLPLAIELAAGRVRAIAPEELVERLDRRFSLLAGGPSGEGGRHRTLRAVVDWSYGLLAEPEARLFDRLSVFAGTFPLSAAEQVCAGPPVVREEVASRLAELVDRSMVSLQRRDDGSHRYRLLDTLREFGAERLVATGDAELYRRAHANHHLAVVEELQPRVRGEDEGVAVASIHELIDELRVAHDRRMAHGDVDRALRLPAALYEYLVFRLRGEVFDWADRALELPRADAHPAYPAVLVTAALGATNRGDPARARRLAEAALAHADAQATSRMQALAVLSNVALYEGRLDEVVERDDRLMELAVEVGDDFWRALAGLDVSLALLYHGELDAARRRAAGFAQAAEATGNPTVRAWARYVHGETLLERDPVEAMEHLSTAIELAREVDSRLPEGVALVSLASLTGRHGETERALGLFRDAVQHWRRLGDHTHQLTTVRNLVELLARIGVDERTAVLHGAVTDASPPSFGAEADRLAAAWEQLTRRMGSDAAVAAAQRGRRLNAAQLADEALATLDHLLGTSTGPSSSPPGVPGVHNRA